MADKTIRHGSLQFWPRKRAKKILHSVNWKPLKKEGTGLMGFMGYKVGMTSVYVKDNTEDSMTKNKRIVIPGTIIECPYVKIFSARFYKDGRVLKDFIVGFDSGLKKKVKKPKKMGKIEDFKADYDNVSVIVYGLVKQTSIKKKPDMVEINLAGSKEEKLAFIKEKVGKEISLKEVFTEGLVDVRGVTKGFGTQGPVKRFGISLKDHKSEKGRRRPGSLAPWHPARVTFRAPQAGQTGFFSRITYNNLILKIGNIKEDDINMEKGFHKYGKIKTDYLILKGSIPGTKKRPLMITPAMRPSRSTIKQKFELIELR